jgi:arylformamidase
MIDWGRMSRADRDAAYNNSAAVADSAEWVSRWTEFSAKRRADARANLDVPYGPGERNKIDIFPGKDPGAPTLVYIHGGYWQRGAREWYACMGEGVAAHGWSSAIVGYTLAPEASLSVIAREVRDAIQAIAANAAQYGIGKRLIISGWSAGGHLTALSLAASGAAAGLAISGIYELGPIRDTYLNEKLSLSDDEVANLSPLRLAPVAKPLAVAYGTRELLPLVHDSRALHALRSEAHVPGPLIPLPGRNHFDALDELRKPDGILTRAALDLAPSLN